jgi:hypothetical protein
MIAGSPERRVTNGANEPPAPIPIWHVDAVAVERFWRNAMPTLPRFAVEMLTAFVESVSVWLWRPVSVMFAVTLLAATDELRKSFEMRYETL